MATASEEAVGTLFAPENPSELIARGYDSAFLGFVVPEPQLTTTGRQHAVGGSSGAEVVRHTHFSLVMHAQRHFAIWVGWNIDGHQLHRLNRNGLSFGPDPLVALKYQVGNQLYANNRLDRGHLARRADLCWGSDAEARQANRESFYFTNITPQLENFNQTQQGGIWGRLEDALFAQIDVQHLRVSVFAGPVFRPTDRPYRGVQIPREFYKVLVYVENSRLQARGFLLAQNLVNLQDIDLEQFRVYQVTLGEVEARCDFRFAEVLKTADGYAEHLAQLPAGTAGLRPHLTALTDIVW